LNNSVLMRQIFKEAIPLVSLAKMRVRLEHLCVKLLKKNVEIVNFKGLIFLNFEMFCLISPTLWRDSWHIVASCSYECWRYRFRM